MPGGGSRRGAIPSLRAGAMAPNGISGSAMRRSRGCRGLGTFGAQTTYAVGTNPAGVAIGDFNGDGHADLAVTNYGSATVSVLLNRSKPTAAPVSRFMVSHRGHGLLFHWRLACASRGELAVTPVPSTATIGGGASADARRCNRAAWTCRCSRRRQGIAPPPWRADRGRYAPYGGRSAWMLCLVGRQSTRDSASMT